MPRVLLIDDDPDVRLIVGSGLELVGGFEVVPAGSGQEGLELAGEEPPDAIIVDLMMPTMDGRATVAAIREDTRLRSIPVVLLTAAAGGLDDSAWRGVDADAVLGKPVDPDVLVGELERLVRVAAERSDAGADDDAMDELLQGTWSRMRPRVLERLETLDHARRQAAAGDLDVRVREAALVEAHRLAGSLGTYGFHDASTAARRAEHELRRDPVDVEALERALSKLRGALAA